MRTCGQATLGGRVLKTVTGRLAIGLLSMVGYVPLAPPARALYRRALDMKPNEPSVLSNLGMSYLLEGDLKSAETHMRAAATAPAT